MPSKSIYNLSDFQKFRRKLARSRIRTVFAFFAILYVYLVLTLVTTTPR